MKIVALKDLINYQRNHCKIQLTGVLLVFNDVAVDKGLEDFRLNEADFLPARAFHHVPNFLPSAHRRPDSLCLH